MIYACLYIVVGIIVLEMVRPEGAKIPPSGVVRALVLWPVTALLALIYALTHARRP